MTISNTELRRYYLVHQILSLRDEQLAQIEIWLASILPTTEALPAFIKPLQKTISVEALQAAQNYTGFYFATFSTLSQAFDTEESTEELLLML